MAIEDLAQYHADRREMLIKLGMCVRCGRKKSVHRLQMCQPCRTAKNAMSRRYRERKAIEKRKAEREAKREARQIAERSRRLQ